MMGKLCKFFWNASGWKLFVPVLVVYLFFGLYIMPQGMKTMRELAGKKVEVLDLQFYYNEARAKEILSAYGPDLLPRAARFELIADTLYPIAYTLLYIVALAWVYKSVSAFRSVWPCIHMIPVIVMLADYCENAGIVLMLTSYPDFGAWLPRITSVFSMIKWSMVGVQSVLLIYGLGLLFYYRVVQNKR